MQETDDTSAQLELFRHRQNVRLQAEQINPLTVEPQPVYVAQHYPGALPPADEAFPPDEISSDPKFLRPRQENSRGLYVGCCMCSVFIAAAIWFMPCFYYWSKCSTN